MNDTFSSGGSGKSDGMKLADLAQINPIDIDDLADVRNLHVSSFRSLGGAIYSDVEIDAFTRQVNSITYSDRIRATSCYGAWIDGYLVGTCGWRSAGEGKTTARISDVFVSPLFSRGGLVVFWSDMLKTVRAMPVFHRSRCGSVITLRRCSWSLDTK